MQEEQYSNREIREFFKDFKETLARIERDFGKSLDDIKIQTTLHNSRMQKIEMKNNEIEIKGSSLSGGLKVMYGVLIILVMPMFWYMFNQLQDVQAKVTQQYPYGVSKSEIK